MKVVILAGGFGSRISEESHLKPKPMIEIGNEPILIHLMKYYSSYGFNDFIICLGYKGFLIKEYFQNLYLHQSDITFDYENHGKIELFNSKNYPWKVTLIDTGLNTMTGGRIKRIKKYVGLDDFMITYGDGLSDVNLNELLYLHKKSKKILTITAVKPEPRFGILEINNNTVSSFLEKPKLDSSWINGGFMVASSHIFDFISDDNTIFEREPMDKLIKEQQLGAYKHEGFWHPMDTLRDKIHLEKILDSNDVPWIKKN